MNNIEYSIDQHGTLHRLEDVSQFYSSAANSQYAGSSLNRPMDEGIVYGSTSYVAGYSQPSYTSPLGVGDSALYDFYELAQLLACSLLYKYFAGVQVPTQVTTANTTSHSPLQNFGTPQPKYFNGLGGQSYDKTGLNPSRTTEGEIGRAHV